MVQSRKCPDKLQIVGFTVHEIGDREGIMLCQKGVDGPSKRIWIYSAVLLN